MPNTARELRGQLGMNKKEYGYIPDLVTTMLAAGHKIGKPTPLFTKIETAQVEILRQKYGGKQESSKIKPEDIKTLEDKIAKQVRNQKSLNSSHFRKKFTTLISDLQGELVRDLKAKHDKSVWQPEVTILLELKKQLVSLQVPETKPAKSPVKKAAKPEIIVPEQNGTVTEDVATLEAAIVKQVSKYFHLISHIKQFSIIF